MQNIPSVDLRDLSDDPARKQKFVNEIGSAFEDIGFVALKGILNDQLVEELYGEIRNFCLTFRNKHVMKSLELRTKRLCFFWNRTCKGRKEGDLKNFGIWTVCV
jgi:isopenicillin N synthase-like dioxygenase